MGQTTSHFARLRASASDQRGRISVA